LAPASATVIEASELTKRYGRRRGIEGVSSVRAGDTFGGAGLMGVGTCPEERMPGKAHRMPER